MCQFFYQNTIKLFSMNQTNSLILLTNANQLQEIIKRNPTVLVDFFAKWCGPCRRLMPQLEKLYEEKKSFTLIKVDVDKHFQLAKTYQVKSLPTLILFKNGSQEEKFTGSDSFEAIKNKV